MAASKGASCIKYTLLILNVLLCIAATILFCSGTMALNNNSLYSTRGFVALGMVLIGFFVFVLACFGCLGAASENTCLLKGYETSLYIIGAADIAFTFLVLIAQDSTKKSLCEKYDDNIIKSVTLGNPENDNNYPLLIEESKDTTSMDKRHAKWDTYFGLIVFMAICRTVLEVIIIFIVSALISSIKRQRVNDAYLVNPVIDPQQQA